VRTLVPELLDFLDPADPRAIRSRCDLMLVNKVMRQSAIMAKALAPLPPPRLWVDLGGGDGRFVLRTIRRLARHWPGGKVLIADRLNLVSSQTRADFAALGWTCESLTGDILETLPGLSPDLITANLFLHHLEDSALPRLLELVARSKAFVACEPERSGFALLGARIIGILGVNDVTRHDALASVRAGFHGQEVSRLWPKTKGWQLGERAVFPFTHLFCAHAL
jgi:hypothetical protein